MSKSATLVYLPEKAQAALRKMAEEESTSVSEVARRIILKKLRDSKRLTG